MNKSLILLFLLLTASSALLAQNNDPVLFTVEKSPVKVSEFKYIYAKTNGEKADFSKKSLEEYLDLYIKFKLKVQKARDMRLDTVAALQRELEGYRQQLASSYLIDKEVTERLLDEAYKRSLNDVSISHIFFSCEKNAPARDTLAVYLRALDAKKRVTNGSITFEDLAVELSDDKSARENKGKIGFVNAPLPNGFYNLENAAYSLPAGKISDPIRTDLGYHLVRVNETRKARGELEVAHILVRKGGDRPDFATKARIDSIYLALQAGANFEEMAKQASEDRLTGPKGGYVGFFGINRYENAFEESAFALKKDGDYTAPVESTAGWHIIKRISKKEVPVYDIAKRRLKPIIQRDSRYDLAREAMIRRIKQDAGFSEDTAVLRPMINQLNKDEFLSHKWKAPNPPSAVKLFVLDGQKTTLGDFEGFVERSSRRRLTMNRDIGMDEAVWTLYTEYVDDNCLKHEETLLDKKYPEFKSLMREYEEGILLFEATKNTVWDKASQDSTGLQKYYDQHKDKYRWEERAVVSIYTLKEAGKDKLQELQEFCKKRKPEKVLEKFNEKGKDPVLSSQEKTFEHGKNKVLDAMKWKEGEQSAVETDARNKSLNFMKIEKVLPAGTKTLQEARGYVVADYQDFLEKKWIDELKKSYKVTVNQSVLDSLVKKP